MGNRLIDGLLQIRERVCIRRFRGGSVTQDPAEGAGLQGSLETIDVQSVVR